MALTIPPSLSVELPLRTVSESNRRGHWSRHVRRIREHRAWTPLLLRQAFGPAVPLLAGMTIVLQRVAPRALDTDNLQSALKAIRDGVADYFAVPDNDPRITWQYGQCVGTIPRYYAVRVTLVPPSVSPEAQAPFMTQTTPDDTTRLQKAREASIAAANAQYAEFLAVQQGQVVRDEAPSPRP